MAQRSDQGARGLTDQERADLERHVKPADPSKVRAAVDKIRKRDAELLRRLAR